MTDDDALVVEVGKSLIEVCDGYVKREIGVGTDMPSIEVAILTALSTVIAVRSAAISPRSRDQEQTAKTCCEIIMKRMRMAAKVGAEH